MLHPIWQDVDQQILTSHTTHLRGTTPLIQTEHVLCTISKLSTLFYKIR